MTKPTLDKKKAFIWTMASLAALLILFIIFKEQFSSFWNDINEKLSVLNSLVIGAVIAYLVNPIEKFFFNCFAKLKIYKTRKFLSILLTYILSIGLIVIFMVIAAPQVVKSINELPLRLKEFVAVVTEKITLWYEEFINSEMYASIVAATGKELDKNEILNSLVETYGDLDALLNSVSEYLIVFFSKLYTGVADTFIGLVFSIYLLASRDRLKAQAKKLTTAIVGTEKIDGVIDTLRYTDHAFGGFIQGKLVNAVIIFILTFIAFWAFGVPYPQLLALIIGITDIIPVFGPFIGAIPSAFIVLIAEPEKVFIMLLMILIIQQIDGNYIGPKILGESTGLSALGVFVAIIVMGGYFGIIGMLIGVPTFAVAQYLITKAVDKRLIEKGVTTDHEDYYTDHENIHSDENAIHNNLFTRIADPIINFLKGGVLSIVNLFKRLPKIRKKSDVISNKKMTESDINEDDTSSPETSSDKDVSNE
jgi:predicted PurR-regulated permease PerM